jgi:hypothetical protein
MLKAWSMNKVWMTLVVLSAVSICGEESNAQSDSDPAEVSYHWIAGKLIPNEFGLPDGTWSSSTLRDCIDKCSADENCVGFSVERKFGDAWAAGCTGALCDAPTECHAKGVYGSSDWWLPNDAAIRVPGVDANSNAWIENWGTLLKK